MSKKVIGSDGKVYKQVVPSDPNRKRTPELIVGGIGLLLSVVGLMSSFGAAAIADAFGGGGIYTLKMSLGLLLAIESLDSVSDVSSLRYKFGGTFANDDTSDEDWSHDYDVTLDLQ